jgi:hypothetical protein
MVSYGPVLRFRPFLGSEVARLLGRSTIVRIGPLARNISGYP